MTKKIGLLCFSIWVSMTLCWSQKIDGNYSSQRTIYVETTNLTRTEKILNDFFMEHHIKILAQKTTQRSIKAEFAVEANMLNQIEEMLNMLGYVTSKDYTYNDNDEAVWKLENEIIRLKTDEQQTATKQNQIAEKKNQIEALKQNKGKTYISLSVSEEDMVGDGITFVTMPGFEYGLLFTENPVAGFSAPLYQTYTLKFLFTRGKSYFLLSMMKSANNFQNDMSLYTEYFMFNFGQDFYTRHLGRGKRRYFNPYISYQVGGFLASNQNTDNKFIFNANVALGVEFIKTKTFLLDSKISYFMPIHHSFVHTRGIQVSIAANVLF